MSLPPELRMLCFQLSSILSTPSTITDLPRLTPSLLKYVLRCQVPLSMPAISGNKAESSTSAKLVHQLKTQLSTLLNGKVAEGRFAAVVLIKAVIETGGWEMLNGSESWVKGLLSILGKPDPAATKELAIIALTKIYCMTHQYQTLVREITTPTLSAFITACLALVAPKSQNKSSTSPGILDETIFEALTMLVPRHTSIFRPFSNQIRAAVRQYLAPTCSDGIYVSSQITNSARRLYVVLHQTAAKNSGGEEWSKAVRQLIKDIHETSDQVFRAVVEDWESASGYSSVAVNVNQDISGGGASNDDLPNWTGVSAGAERLVGLIELLAVYLKEDTAAPVNIPIGDIMDMVNRMLSIAIPATSISHTGASARFHPAISRDERDMLYTCLPSVYVAALQLSMMVEKRLQYNFVSVAQGLLEQLVWVFPFGKQDEEFRTIAYEVAAIIFNHIGRSLDRSQVGKNYDIIRSCCKDLAVDVPEAAAPTPTPTTKGQPPKTHNVDTFLHHITSTPSQNASPDTPLILNASSLLTLSLSHLPQQYVDLSIRCLIERTAVLTHNKSAILASTLYPFTGKNNRPLAALLPHLTQEFGDDATVEILLRPRMPLLPASATKPPSNEAMEDIEEEEDEEMLGDAPEAGTENGHAPIMKFDAKTGTYGVPSPAATTLNAPAPATAPQSAEPSMSMFGSGRNAPLNFKMSESMKNTMDQYKPVVDDGDVDMGERDEQSNGADVGSAGAGGEDSDSDDESVHLTMALDTDSEDED